MKKFFSSNKNVALTDNEKLVLVATVHTEKVAAEKRFTEALAGRNRPIADGIPLYTLIKTDSSCTNSLTAGEKSVCDEIVGDFIQIFREYGKSK